MIELTDEILRKVIKKRKKDSYKGTYRRLLGIGGNAHQSIQSYCYFTAFRVKIKP